jgi:endoglucanase
MEYFINKKFLLGFLAILFACETAFAQAPSSPQPFRDITASQLVSEMTVGWNLGNTLDAHHSSWRNGNRPVSQMETGWGNPVTTRANIDAVKAAGFNTIRIPVSWSKAIDANYNIRADWMARVTEVVNYAAANDMYILLNSHHDEDIFKFTTAERAASLAAFRRIWEQVANNFRNYNEKLIFEGLNEPRVIGTAEEWNGGTSAQRGVLNEHYQVFVDVVRASGGNNNKRILMVNTYAASGTAAAINGLVIPNDTAQNKIIVSIHNYAPAPFALTPRSDRSSVTAWSRNNSSHTSPIRNPIDLAYNKFVRNGIPVIIGEFSAMNKNNEAAIAEWADYYVSYAKSRNIPCVWWDNGITDVSNNDSMGIFNRRTNRWAFPQIVAALMNAANSSQAAVAPSVSPSPPAAAATTTITGNLGNYTLGMQNDNVTPNTNLAVWELSEENTVLAKRAGTKLVLRLTNSPAATMQFVWQGPSTQSWWNQKDILGGTGNPLTNSVTWNENTMTLTINLDRNTIENYSSGNRFTAQPSLRLLIHYFGSGGVDGLGITSASLTQ